MSTRGCVAVRREDGGWDGVYNHSDSYPRELGREVFRTVRVVPAAARPQFTLQLLAAGDWRDFREPGSSRTCGPRMTSEDVNTLTIEWVYVIDPFRHEIEVLTSMPDGERYTSMGTFPIDSPFGADAVERRASVLSG